MGVKIACSLCLMQAFLALAWRLHGQAGWSFLYGQCNGILIGITTASLFALIFDARIKPPVWWGWYMVAANSVSSIWFASTTARVASVAGLFVGTLLW